MKKSMVKKIALMAMVGSVLTYGNAWGAGSNLNVDASDELSKYSSNHVIVGKHLNQISDEHFAYAYNGNSAAETETWTLQSYTDKKETKYYQWLNVYGGNKSSSSDTVSVGNNSVTIVGGTFNSSGGTIYGGYAKTSSNNKDATASSNTVTISGGQGIKNVYGGYAESTEHHATATDNQVILSAGSYSGTIYGNYAKADNVATANVADNSTKVHVNISDGTYSGDIYGGYAYTDHDTDGATVNGMKVQISGGTFSSGKNIYGGYAYGAYNSGNGNSAVAKNNSVTISGGTFTNVNIYAGYADVKKGDKKTATGNKIAITATDAKLSLSGATLYGSNITPNAAVTGDNANVLDLTGVSVSLNVKAINNFNVITFGANTGTLNLSASSNLKYATIDATAIINMSTNELTLIEVGGGPGEKLTKDNVTVKTAGSITSYAKDNDTNGVYTKSYSLTGDVADKKISIKKGQSTDGTIVAGVYYDSNGGHAVNAQGEIVTATSGTLTINSDVSTTGKSYYGSYAADGTTATGGTLNVTGGKVGDIHGGYSATGNVTDNTVNISGGEVTGNVYAGKSGSGTVTGNTLNWSGGTIKGSEIKGNNVNITGTAAKYLGTTGTVTADNAVTLDGILTIGEGATASTLTITNGISVASGKSSSLVGGSTAASTLNGAIANAGTLTVSNLNLGGNVTGGGSLVVDGTVGVGTNSITQGNLTINASKKLTVNTDNLIITNAITNNGELVLNSAGTLQEGVTGSGYTTISAAVVAEGALSSTNATKGVDVVSGGKLTIAAANLQTKVVNATEVVLNAGTMGTNGSISGAGKITTGGNVIAGVTTLNTTDATNGIVNAHTLTLTDNGELGGKVTGAGTLQIGDGTNTAAVTNTSNKSIANNIDIEANGTFTSALGNLTGNTITNDGTFNTSGTLTKNISGSGTTVLNGDLTSNTAVTIAGTLNGNSQTIDMQDSPATYTILTVGKLTGTTNLKIDVDMSNFTADKLAVGIITDATVNLTDINVTKDIALTSGGILELPKEEDSKITYVSNQAGTGVVASGGIYTIKDSATGSIEKQSVVTNNYKYTFTKGATDGTLKYKVEAVDLTFKQFVEGTLGDGTNDPATLSLTGNMKDDDADMIVATQSNTTLTINLNGNTLGTTTGKKVTVGTKTMNIDGGTTQGTVYTGWTVAEGGKLNTSGLLKMEGLVTGDGTLKNTGTLDITANNLKVATFNTNGTINLGAGTLTKTITGGNMALTGDVSADVANLKTTGGITNTHTLTLTNAAAQTAALTDNITGTNGTVVIDGNISTEKNITNAVTINSAKQFTISGTITGTIVNKGTLNLNSKYTNTTAIDNDGALNVTADRLKAAVDNAGTVNLGAGTLTADKKITGGKINVEGAVTAGANDLASTSGITVKNNATLTLNAGNIQDAIGIETGGTGALTIAGVVTDTNNKTITVNKLTITSGSLTTDPDNLVITNGIENNADGGLVLNAAGTLEENVSGSGYTTIKAAVEATGVLSSTNATKGVDVVTGGKLTIAADKLQTKVANATEVVLNAGTMGTNGSISGAGKITTGGNVTAGVTTLNTTDATNGIVNAHTLTLTGNGELGGKVTGTGTLQIGNGVNTAVVTNTNGKSIANNIDIKANGTFTSALGNLSGSVKNDGTFNMSGDLTKNITGAGTTKLQSSTVKSNTAVTIDGTLDVNGKTIDMTGNNTTTLTVGTLTGTDKLKIDAVLAIDSITIDNITAGSASGAVTLETVSFSGSTDVWSGTKEVILVKSSSGDCSGLGFTDVAFAYNDYTYEFAKKTVNSTKDLVLTVTQSSGLPSVIQGGNITDYKLKEDTELKTDMGVFNEKTTTRPSLTIDGDNGEGGKYKLSANGKGGVTINGANDKLTIKNTIIEDFDTFATVNNGELILNNVEFTNSKTADVNNKSKHTVIIDGVVTLDKGIIGDGSIKQNAGSTLVVDGNTWRNKKLFTGVNTKDQLQIANSAELEIKNAKGWDYYSLVSGDAVADGTLSPKDLWEVKETLEKQGFMSEYDVKDGVVTLEFRNIPLAVEANTSALAGVQQGAISMVNQVADAIGENVGILARPAQEGVYDKTVWANYINSKETVNGMSIWRGEGNNTAKYHGVTVGADFYTTKKSIAGVALTYVSGDVMANPSDTVINNKTKYYGISFYDRITNGKSALVYDLGYSQGKNDITQNSYQTVTADAITNVYTLGAKYEYAYNFKHSSLVPFASLRYLRLTSNDYRNSNGHNMSIDRQNLIVPKLGLAWTGSFEMPKSDWTFKPVAEVGYIWNLKGREADGTFTTRNSSYSVQYDTVDKSSYYTKLGLNFNKKNFTGGVSYRYAKGDAARQNSWNVNLSWNF